MLDSPSSLSLSSQERCSIPLIIFVASSGPAPTGPCLSCAKASRPGWQDSRWGLTRAEQWDRIPSLNLLATLLLMQPRRQYTVLILKDLRRSWSGMYTLLILKKLSAVGISPSICTTWTSHTGLMLVSNICEALKANGIKQWFKRRPRQNVLVNRMFW